MFRVKICGLVRPADAVAAVAHGADAVGLNFYPPSPRYISESRAQEIVASLPPGIARVGVFVNSPASEVRTLAERLRLDYVQIHGDEPPRFLAELCGLPTIRAMRCGDDLSGLFQYLDDCRRIDALPAALLVDAHRQGHYGGTGAVADWAALGAARARLADVPLVLAGGLNPDNIAAAIRAVRPDAVDTASGVETAPGHKSAALMQSFVQAALEAFEQPRAD